MQLVRDVRGCVERAQPWMGTYVAIQVEGVFAQMNEAVDAAFAAIGRVHADMSFHDPDSGLSQLNRAECRKPVVVSHQLRRVLLAALALAKASAGRFDPTVAGRLVASGCLPAPSSRTIDPHADWRDVQLLADGRVQLLRPLWLDLGGIAKGYAVDQAIRVLRRFGVRRATVNAGGDLRTYGKTVAVQVRDVANPGRAIPCLRIRDAAVATSAGYFTGRDGQDALMHPYTGTTMGKDISVTVCAPRAIWADALTKVVMADIEQASPALSRLGASAMVLYADGRRRKVD